MKTPDNRLCHRGSSDWERAMSHLIWVAASGWRLPPTLRQVWCFLSQFDLGERPTGKLLL